MTEEEFQQAVIDLARALGWRVYHTRNSQGSEPGFPDLTLAKPPWLAVGELKSSRTKHPTPDQVWWLEAFATSSVPAFLWTPEDWPEIEAFLRDPAAATAQPSSALAAPRTAGDGDTGGRGVGAHAGDARAARHDELSVWQAADALLASGEVAGQGYALRIAGIALEAVK